MKGDGPDRGRYPAAGTLPSKGDIPVPDREKFTPPPDQDLPDLSKFNETTRRAVYRHVFTVAFSEPYMNDGGLRSGAEFPKDAAERAELTVFWAFGRWFAA